MDEVVVIMQQVIANEAFFFLSYTCISIGLHGSGDMDEVTVTKVDGKFIQVI